MARRTVDLLLHSAAQLLTLPGGPQRGSAMGQLGLVAEGALAADDGRVVAVGATRDLRARFRGREEVDASGRAVLPGFVDAHTHLVWAGDRALEFEQRLAGASYLEILASGGGILSTVQATRAAGLGELVRLGRRRAMGLLAHGTTTLEVKTGYGLELAAELKLLQAIRRLQIGLPMDLRATFLGAHAVPSEYEGRTGEYARIVAEEMLPAVRRWWLEGAPGQALPFVDVFCEAGAFDLAQSRAILEPARALGFPLKIHADEFSSLGGTRLAVEVGAVSADHLIRITEADLRLLAGSSTAAVLLPATPFGLAEDRQAPARALLEAGALVALASDLNPGTAWCESMPFVIALACRAYRWTPAQAIAAATINGAAALGMAEEVGSLEPGKRADLIVLDAPDYRHLGYRFGGNPVAAVYCAARRARIR
jgi:imidazolonepropionase